MLKTTPSIVSIEIERLLSAWIDFAEGRGRDAAHRQCFADACRWFRLSYELGHVRAKLYNTDTGGDQSGRKQQVSA